MGNGFNLQYHPQFQWINEAANDYHTELSKPDSQERAEHLDALLSDIISGLTHYLKTLHSTRRSIGILDQEDIVQGVLVNVLRDPSRTRNKEGWLERYNPSAGIPFLGYIANMTDGGVLHEIRDELPGTARTQDLHQTLNKSKELALQENPNLDLDDFRIGILNSMGVGRDQVNSLEALEKLSVLYLDDPIGEGINLCDTLRETSAAGALADIDRTHIQIDITRMLPSHQGPLTSVLEDGAWLHEIDFDRSMSLIEKAVFMSTCFRVGKARALLLSD